MKKRKSSGGGAMETGREKERENGDNRGLGGLRLALGFLSVELCIWNAGCVEALISIFLS